MPALRPRRDDKQPRQCCHRRPRLRKQRGAEAASQLRPSREGSGPQVKAYPGWGACRAPQQGPSYDRTRCRKALTHNAKRTDRPTDANRWPLQHGGVPRPLTRSLTHSANRRHPHMVERIGVDHSSCSDLATCTCGWRSLHSTREGAWTAGHAHALASHPGDMSGHVFKSQNRYKQ
jgi:hypothetical protein